MFGLKQVITPIFSSFDFKQYFFFLARLFSKCSHFIYAGASKDSSLSGDKFSIGFI